MTWGVRTCSTLRRGESLPALCRALAPGAAGVAAARDAALRAKLLGISVDEDDGAGAAAGAVNESFSVAQATLLALVCVEVANAPPEEPCDSDDNGSDKCAGSDENNGGGGKDGSAPPVLVLSEGTLAYVLDLTSRAAEATAENEAAGNEAEAAPARAVLLECLSLLRRLSERDVHPSVLLTPGRARLKLLATS